jgi:heme a synthase
LPVTRKSFQLPLLLMAACLAFCVVGLGAYVRLSDAGLGCPDWPGCYGHLVGVPDSHAEHVEAAMAFPGKPVEAHKAWKEMIHRYAAGTLGLLILGIAIFAWRNAQSGACPWLETGLVGLVVFQALLGMWTVTLLLKPVIVTAHLLGGMTTWGILAALTAQKLGAGRTAPFPAGTALMAGLALAVLVMQIALGGWVSSNYAALACADFPTCQGNWWPTATAGDYAQAFQVQRELGQTTDGALLSQAALSVIHWTHRLGALATFVIVGAYALLLMNDPAMRRHGMRVGAALLLQVGLGISNVLFSLPLPVAVAHNLGAALLLAALAVSIVPSRNPAHDH